MKQVSAGTTTTTTYYIRDAQGNVLAVYTRNNNDPVKWSEQHLYGSSRLGMWRWDTIVPASAPVIGNNDYIYDSITLGSRTYELANHLGNVLATISDKKIGVDSNGVVKNYIAEVLSQNDYYPFGMSIPTRLWAPGGRYQFNGKEQDPEVKGTGVQYDYGFRIYDSRLGRFNSVDPLTRTYPWYTPYQFAGNTPIQATDLDGKEEYHYTLTLNKNGSSTLHLTSVKYYNDYSWGPFHIRQKINTERALVKYNNDQYYIGFSGVYGNGNENMMPVFNLWKVNPHAKLFTNLFYSENDSYKAGMEQAIEQTRGSLLSMLSMSFISDPSGRTTHMVGSKGTQIASKTTWNIGKTARIDVENPNPGQRPGQIHYQDENNEKYMYNINENKFYGINNLTGEFTDEAPKSVNNLLKDKNVQKGINKALKYLGEEPKFKN